MFLNKSTIFNSYVLSNYIVYNQKQYHMTSLFDILGFSISLHKFNSSSLVKTLRKVCMREEFGSANTQFKIRHGKQNFYEGCLLEFLELAHDEAAQQLQQSMQKIKKKFSKGCRSKLLHLQFSIADELQNQKGVFRSIIQLWVCFIRYNILAYQTNYSKDSQKLLMNFLHEQINKFAFFILIAYKNLIELKKPNFFQEMEDSEIEKVQIVILPEIKTTLSKNKYFSSIFYDTVNLLTGDIQKADKSAYQRHAEEITKIIPDGFSAEQFFCNSLRTLNSFCQTSCLNMKLSYLLQLRNSISEDLKNSRYHIQQEESFLINVYFFLIRNVQKNVFGSCLYLEILILPEQLNFSCERTARIGLRQQFVNYMNCPSYDKMLVTLKSHASIQFE